MQGIPYLVGFALLIKINTGLIFKSLGDKCFQFLILTATYGEYIYLLVSDFQFI